MKHLYNLPHPPDRPGQADAIEWCIGLKGIGIIEACTGSGKTSFAAGTSSRQRVIATCATKNLQQSNYGDTYNFDILFGKANYPCAYPDSLSLSPRDCQYSNKLHKCPKRDICAYQVIKHRCQKSTRTCLNNAYYLSAMWPKDDPPTTLFLDEAHELHEFVTRWAGCAIAEKERAEWSLPQFPTITHLVANTLLRLPPPVDLALPWVIHSHAIMQGHYRDVKAAATTDAGRKRLQRCENLGRKLSATLSALRSHRADWYVRSGIEAREVRGRAEPGFVCKPLTARWGFGDYFLSGAKNVVLMSATVGNIASFAEELGLEDYQFKSIPNRYQPESRQIYALDVPSMSSKATELDFEKQAVEIANLIKSVDHSWSGLIHVTRKRESLLLANRLAKLGLEDRVWPFTGHDGDYRPTDKQVKDWHKRLVQVPNSIGIGWSVATGYDGAQEKINIVAKVPYPIYGANGSYEEAWRSYSHRRYLWQSACSLMQAVGRTRRGKDEDYDLNGKVNGVVAIADGSWGRVKSQLSNDFLDSVVKL